VTENFTGKEKDDETELGYWGARYLDLMLGVWTSVDPKRQFSSPYLYAGNGVNPVNGMDEDGSIITFASVNETRMYNQLFSSLTTEAQNRIRTLEQSKYVYKLNYRPAETKIKTEKYGSMTMTKEYEKKGQFIPNENGAEIFLMEQRVH